MIARILQSCLLVPLITLSGVALPAAGQDAGNTRSSPFEPPARPSAKQIATPATPPKPPKPLNTNLELRGIMQWRETWHFSIHDRSTKESYWISREEGVEGFEVGQWDEFSGKLKLKDGTVLELKEPSGKSIPIAGRPTTKKAPSPPSKPNIPSPTIIHKSNRSTRSPSTSRVPPPRVPPRTRQVRP